MKLQTGKNSTGKLNKEADIPAIYLWGPFQVSSQIHSLMEMLSVDPAKYDSGEIIEFHARGGN